MTDENQALRELLQNALRQIEVLQAEKERLERRLERLERPSLPVDLYDLTIYDDKQSACPWTGWSA